MTGAELTKKVQKYIEEHYGGYVVNVIVASKSGTADLLACVNGNFFAFEIKGKGDKANPLQDNKLSKVAKAGGYGGYVRNLEEVNRIIIDKIVPEFVEKEDYLDL